MLTAADLVDPTGRFRVERLRSQDGSAGAPFDAGEVRVVKVAAAGSDLVRLVCVSPDRPLDPDDVQALERAATVVALLVTRQQAVAAVENKYRGDFLRDVFLGRAGDDAVRGRARPRAGVGAGPAGGGAERRGRPARRVGGAGVRRRCAGSGRTGSRRPGAWCARPVTAPSPPPTSPPRWSRSSPCRRPRPTPTGTGCCGHEVDQVVAEVAGDRGGGRRPFSVGVSRPVLELGGLPAAYQQARRATVVGRRIRGGRSATWFDDLGLHRLIALVPDEAELHAFADDVLGELAGDSAEAVDLRTTLQVLLDTNLNVAEAARLQFFHYNTMRYRVGQARAAAGAVHLRPAPAARRRGRPAGARVPPLTAVARAEGHDTPKSGSASARRCRGPARSPWWRAPAREHVVGTAPRGQPVPSPVGGVRHFSPVSAPVNRNSVCRISAQQHERTRESPCPCSSGTSSTTARPRHQEPRSGRWNGSAGAAPPGSARSTWSRCSARRSSSRSSWGSTRTSRSCSPASARSCSC